MIVAVEVLVAVLVELGCHGIFDVLMLMPVGMIGGSVVEEFLSGALGLTGFPGIRELFRLSTLYWKQCTFINRV